MPEFDCRKSKLTRSTARLRCLHFTLRSTPTTTSLLANTHTRFLGHTFSTIAFLKFLPVSHNISSSVLSDLIHSAFSVRRLAPSPFRHGRHAFPPNRNTATLRLTLIRHTAFGLPKNKIWGTSVATPGVLGTEPRHRHSTASPGQFITTTCKITLGIFPQFGVLVAASVAWIRPGRQGWKIRRRRRRFIPSDAGVLMDLF